MVMNRWLAAILLAALAAPAHGQERRLYAGGLRPLSEAVQQLSERHGWRISYEETVALHAEDIQRGGEPRGGFVNVEYDPAEGAGPVLRRIVADHTGRGNVGRFAVSRESGRWLVSVAEMRGRNGEWVQARSPLEYPVTVSKGVWGLMPLLEEMGRQLSLHTGFKVWMTPGLASSWLMQNWASIVATNEKARTVLARTLTAARRNDNAPAYGTGTTWQVVCRQSYGCSMRLVRDGPLPAFPPPTARNPLDSLGPFNRPMPRR